MQLIFIIGGFTVFRFSYIESEGDLHLKSFVFAWTLRYLKDLHPLFTKICKSCPNSFTFTVFFHHIYDQRQLCNFFLTFGKLSYECLSARSARWLSIYIVRSLEGWYYVATCCSFPEWTKWYLIWGQLNIWGYYCDEDDSEWYGRRWRRMCLISSVFNLIIYSILVLYKITRV